MAPTLGFQQSRCQDSESVPEPRKASSLSSDHHPQQHQALGATAIDTNHLSPFISNDAFSPSSNSLETPACSTSSAGHYQTSDYSEFEDDPLFGVDFDNPGSSTPSFLEQADEWGQPTSNTDNSFPQQLTHETIVSVGDDANNTASYPLTPGHTTFSSSPHQPDHKGFVLPINTSVSDSISPAELQQPFQPASAVTQTSQLTPSQSGSCPSSEDEMPPHSSSKMEISPKVTISNWDDKPASSIPMDPDLEESPTTVRGGFTTAGDLMTSSSYHDPQISSSQAHSNNWGDDEAAPRRSGLDPLSRPSDQVPSLKEASTDREIQARNLDVSKWLSHDEIDMSVPKERSAAEIAAIDKPGQDSNDDIAVGGSTENQAKPGQTLFTEGGGQMEEEDYRIILASRNWGDAPVLRSISKAGHIRHQPQSSQAAIEKFNRLYQDTDSILSRAATWGTRRRSLPSVADLDLEEVTSGSILKKLSLNSKSNDKSSRPSSIFKDLRDSVTRAGKTSLLKRTRSQQGRPKPEDGAPLAKRDSGPHLTLPEGATNWGKNKTPSINTALISMGHASASIASAHTPRGSVSGTASVNSPRSPRNSLSIVSPRSPRNSLSVISSLGRPRSKSELPKASSPVIGGEGHSNLIGMLARSGGPPVPTFSRPSLDADDEEEDDDELNEEADADMQQEANLIDEITPNLAGFQQHIVILNPNLAYANQFLVERIGHQQIIRYKQLLNAKVKHLGLGANCASGPLCVALSGSARILDAKGGHRSAESLSNSYDEDDGTPLDGAISQESFPSDIPKPPTDYLPAELECQLCFQKKKFQKPSDWTKHVHEDVQPFTCTWDKCKEAKMFKRKADWVRHENEGHRQLEWWKCDVEDCNHLCYRRDNFLQHLVREHKFIEPKIKTKAAVKKAGKLDPTWQKVESCHKETPKRPQEEPCRFCGRQFPTWKKLTVHLAKHMEQITLPVLRLVAAKAKELSEDSIISPVQDPPQRNSLLFPSAENTPLGTYPPAMPTAGYVHDPNALMYQNLPRDQYSHQNMPGQYNNIGYNLHHSPMTDGGVHQPQYSNFQHGHNIVGNEMFPQGPSNGYNMHMAPNSNNGHVSHNQYHPQINALGLHNVPPVSMSGQPVVYENNGMMDPSSSHGSPFSGPGSVSPFQTSPQGHGWDNRQMPGFM